MCTFFINIILLCFSVSELKKKYTTGNSKLSKRQLGLNTYTDCEQIFTTLSQGENGKNKESSDDSDVELDIVTLGKQNYI